MAFLRTSLLLFLFLTTALAAQDVVNSWGRSFALPGTNPRYLAVASEGDVIAVQTAEGVRLYEDGVWGELLPFDTVIDRQDYELWYPSQTLAVYQGSPWVIHDSLYRHNGVEWVTVPLPRTVGRQVHATDDLIVHQQELYIVPDVHRWTGSDWEPILPECITHVDGAAISERGKWLLTAGSGLGCDLGSAAIIDGDTAWKLSEWIPNYNGFGIGHTFYGEEPIVAGHRLDSSGRWVEIGDILGPYFDAQIHYAKTPSKTQYALLPGWEYTFLYSAVPCSNRIYRLDSNELTPVSGWFDSPAVNIAKWRDTGIVVAGRFLSDHEGFVGNGIATFDGQKWDALNDPGETYLGVVGTVLDVELLGDSLWVGGARLYTDGAEAAHPILLFLDGEWYPVPGISGSVSHLAIHDGDLHAAGLLSLPDQDSVRLARLRNGVWEAIEVEPITVSELKTANGSLYLSGWSDVLGQPDPSWLYQIEDGVVIPRLSRWGGRIHTFEVVDSVIFLGGENAFFYRFWPETGQMDSLSRPSQKLMIQELGPNGPDWERPSIDALHWHMGALFVGGTFGATPSGYTGNVARYVNGAWSSLNKGVVSAPYGHELLCPLYQVSVHKVREISSLGDKVLIAGKFEYLSRFVDITDTLGWWNPKLSEGGRSVDFPLALFDPETSRLYPAAPSASPGEEHGGEIFGMKVEDGRIAIGGKFIMPGPSRSQNVALSDKLLSVEVDQRPEPAASAAIQLLYDGVDAYVETQERRQITIELYDLSGRRLMILYRGSLDAGRTVLSVPDDLPTGSYLVRARDGEGGSSTMVIGR